MQRAHVVTTTSELLADERQFSRDARAHDGIVIGWVAGLEHRADVQRLGLTNVLREVLERDPRVRVVTAGVKLDLDAGRYTHHDDQWADTLVGLAGARIRRAQLRRRAEAWGRSQHIAEHIDRWEAVLRSAAEQAQRQVA